MSWCILHDRVCLNHACCLKGSLLVSYSKFFRAEGLVFGSAGVHTHPKCRLVVPCHASFVNKIELGTIAITITTIINRHCVMNIYEPFIDLSFNIYSLNEYDSMVNIFQNICWGNSFCS